MNLFGAATLAVISLFLVFILRKAKKAPVDYLLFLINIQMANILLSEHLVKSSDLEGWKLFFHFNSSFWLGFLIITYSYSLIEGKGKLYIRWWFFLFLVPFFLYSGYDLLLDASKSPEQYAVILQAPNWVYHLFFKLHKLFIILLGFDILRRIKQRNVNLEQSFSYKDNLSLDWLRNYIVVTISLFLFHLVSFLLYNFKWIYSIDLVYEINGVAMLLGVFYLSFRGIQQYNYPSLADSFHSGETPEKDLVDNQNRGSSEDKAIFAQIQLLFEQEQLFREPLLKIGDVAKKVGIPTHRLSQAINSEFGQPFYGFVAQYRVEFLKQELLDPKNSAFTILTLALESGFNSKASVNRLFKEHTGLTPSQYQKSHLAK
jgi:AraC-like DNA-binding protein